jgi:hypothetical protein
LLGDRGGRQYRNTTKHKNSVEFITELCKEESSQEKNEVLKKINPNIKFHIQQNYFSRMKEK